MSGAVDAGRRGPLRRAWGDRWRRRWKKSYRPARDHAIAGLVGLGRRLAGVIGLRRMRRIVDEIMPLVVSCRGSVSLGRLRSSTWHMPSRSFGPRSASGTSRRCSAVSAAPSSTPIGPAALSLRTGAAVVGVFIHREEDGTHVIRVTRPGLPYRAAAAEMGKEAWHTEATARLTSLIETEVRRRPDEWVWWHRRWA